MLTISVLFSSRVGSVWLVSGYAPVFALVSAVGDGRTINVPGPTERAHALPDAQLAAASDAQAMPASAPRDSICACAAPAQFPPGAADRKRHRRISGASPPSCRCCRGF